MELSTMIIETLAIVGGLTIYCLVSIRIFKPYLEKRELKRYLKK